MKEPLRDSERLKHILEAINNIEIASDNITKAELLENFILRHGLTWNIMVIREAVNKLSKDFCDVHKDIPWRQIAGMRHVLVHDYYQIDVDELWDVIISDLPILKGQIESIIDDITLS